MDSIEIGKTYILSPHRNAEYRTPCCDREIWSFESSSTPNRLFAYSSWVEYEGRSISVLVTGKTQTFYCPYCQTPEVLSGEGFYLVQNKSLWGDHKTVVPYTWLRPVP